MTGLPVVLIGAGGHAMVVLSMLFAAGIPVAAILDSDPARAGTTLLGFPITGGDEALAARSQGTVLLANGVGSAGQPAARRGVYERFKKLGHKFATVVHPSAVIGPEVSLGEGAQVMAGAIIQAGTRIGANAIVNTRAAIDHDCDIGDHAHVAPGAVLCGGVVVAEAAHIGAGAVIIQYLTVGTGVLVPAQSLVTESVPSPAVASEYSGKGRP